jgi:hypothetical protein
MCPKLRNARSRRPRRCDLIAEVSLVKSRRMAFALPVDPELNRTTPACPLARSSAIKGWPAGAQSAFLTAVSSSAWNSSCSEAQHCDTLARGESDQDGCRLRAVVSGDGNGIPGLHLQLVQTLEPVTNATEKISIGDGTALEDERFTGCMLLEARE